MARWLGLPRVYLFLAAIVGEVLADGAASLDSAAAVGAALPADDECLRGDGDSSSCAVQAMQLRAKKQAVADLATAVAHSGEAPAASGSAATWRAVMAPIAPKIRDLVFVDGEIDVSEKMKKALLGTCLRVEEYNESTEPFSDFWQCGNAGNVNFGDNAYTPSERVARRLANFSGVSLDALADIHLNSGNSSESLVGKWCGMPAPPEYVDSSGTKVGNVQFWEDCVMRNAGYFNTLVCNTSGTYAVLGIAALNHGTCYPAHEHDNQEAYWQIAGPGTWRTWPQNFVNKPNERPDSEIRITSPEARQQLHNHPAGLIHEMDTTKDDDFLLAVYWWAKPAGVAVNYAYSHGVHEQGSCFRQFVSEHTDEAHSCPRQVRPSWAPRHE